MSLAGKDHPPRSRPGETHDGLQRRALAHTVPAQEAHDLTAVYVERDPLQDVARSVERMKIVDLEKQLNSPRGPGRHL